MRRLPPIDPIWPFAAIGLLALLLSGLCNTARADDPVSSLVRYNREIVRIFDRKCVACHTDRGLSVPLDSYHDVRPWAQAIREEILERRMPPWPAATGVRPLANELGLTTREIAIITAWIDGGTPRGEPGDLPPPTPHTTWPAGEPDLKLALPVQQLKPDGTAYVRRVTSATGLTRDRWLRGFDVAPGDRRVLRSLFLFLKTAAGEQWLGGWTPWYAMTSTPEHIGFRVPAGASLIAELHYLAWDESDRPLADESTVGLYFLTERPASLVQEMTVKTAAVDGARKMRGEAGITGDAVVWALRPRLERDGVALPGSIEIRAIKPDGAVEPLLWINDNRPDWQLPYVLREPIRLARGARIVVTAHPDMSRLKPAPTTIGAVASVLTYSPLREPSTEPSPRR